MPSRHNNDPKKVMKQYNVVFGGTIRDVAKYIQQGLKNIDRCGQKFRDYAVILYENDSKDETRTILQKHKKANYHYILEDDIKEPLRTLRLSNGRNKILNTMREINKDGYYDYLIMLDIDDINESGKFVESVESCFKYDNWDVLTGNQSGTYYDLWALRKKHDMDHDCIRKMKEHSDDPDAYNKYVKSKFKHYPENDLLEVDSAFGGIAIYRTRSIPSHCKYVGKYQNGEEKCEHVEFHECIKHNGGSIYINTSFLTS